jgi:hypothetical protein
VTAQQSRLSDGNTRVTLQGYARYELSPGLYAVYSASRLAFAQRSSRYWDPLDYVAQGAGLEIAARAPYGMSCALTALPGWAWTREMTPASAPVGGRQRRVVAPEIVNHSAFQLMTSGELTWRDPQWVGSMALSYGRGRAGDYQRLAMTITARAYP